MASVASREDVRACQICGSEARNAMFRDGPYEVMRCEGCGLVYVTPRLSGEALRAVYGADYWQSQSPKTKGYADYAKDAELYLKTFRRRFKMLRRFLGAKPRRVLAVKGRAQRLTDEKRHREAHRRFRSEPHRESVRPPRRSILFVHDARHTQNSAGDHARHRCIPTKTDDHHWAPRTNNAQGLPNCSHDREGGFHVLETDAPRNATAGQ